ncbi:MULTISPECIES: DUF3037 domain-containing protein [unclassified Myroides]|uniref:DUF3037 domain-containing protein n=1 Tax=unclassified Myroides TaxID=2642485 RepID=UPI0015F8C53D|nr:MULTISPECIES: DUF3037 domain-containing protein [unclassified Myroides]MBB1150116.1 DUF3037 domain-containing protein [Myroides sp. NP-2]MDM1408336.1 DUF3037 domain-containing protein [Myroides sp. DF42-4-2]
MLVYEYAVIRFVPRVERGEFINIGLLLFCKQKRMVQGQYYLDRGKLSCFRTEVDYDSLETHVKAFISIAEAEAKTSPINSFDAAERFRWLAATKSSCIQVSATHCGLTADINQTFEQLFDELVL